MKPRKLVMSAFGSYASKETIDFTNMDSGLFLIAGNTGSGKSTIFDAIMFALYDTLSGKERKGNMMRSEYANEDVETYVEYTFSYGASDQSENYTIKRYPTYYRRAKRKNKAGGYNMTKQGGKVSLIMPDGREYPGKAAEINQKIRDIIGLTADQFSKIAMIAQGEFQELIMDKTGKRKEIFQQIFSTEIYEQMEKKILEQYKKCIYAIKDNTLKLQETVKGIALEENDSSLMEKWNEVLGFLDTEPERLEAFLGEYLKEREEVLENEKKEVAQSEKAFQQASFTYKEVLSVNKLLEEYQSTLVLLNELKEQEKEITKKEELCVIAQNARSCHQLEEKFLYYKKEEENEQKNKKMYQEEVDALLKELADVRDKKKKYREYYEKRQPEIINSQQKVREEIEKLKELKQEEMKLQTLEKTGDEAKKEKETLQKEEKKLETEQLKIKEWLNSHTTIEVAAEHIRQELAKVMEKKEKLESYKEQYTEFKLQYQRLCNSQKNLLEALKEWEEKRHDYEEKNHGYIVAQSAFLAMELKEDSPCPVCGSLNHPEPAKATKELVTKTMLDSAQKAEQMAQIQKEKCQSDVATKLSVFQNTAEYLIQEGKLLFGNTMNFERYQKAVEAFDYLDSDNLFVQEIVQCDKSERIETGKEEFSCDTAHTNQDGSIWQAIQALEQKMQDDIDEFQTEQAKIQKEIEVKTKYLDTQISLEGKMSELSKKSSENEEVVNKSMIQVESLKMQVLSLREKITITFLQEGQVQLENLMNELDSISKEMSHIDEIFESCQKSVDTLAGKQKENDKRLRELAEEIKRSKMLFDDALRDKHFEEEEAYYHALEYVIQIDQMQEQIQNYKLSRAQCDSKLQTLEKSVEGKKEQSVEAFKEVMEQAERTWQQHKDLYEQMHYKYQTNQRIASRVKELLKGKEKMAEERRVMRSLNDVANGKIHFQTYIQRQYFKKIIQAANRRLSKMTSNQFLLKCREISNSGQGEVGLDLDVINPLTQKVRDAHTLSGGETFLASLSMALGMADIVQGTVSRTRLDTMFIDEGFGALSEEVRNTAVRVLLELAGDKRLVGVISHVTELKEQIPAKLIVTKGSQGSKVGWNID